MYLLIDLFDLKYKLEWADFSTLTNLNRVTSKYLFSGQA